MVGKSRSRTNERNVRKNEEHVFIQRAEDTGRTSFFCKERMAEREEGKKIDDRCVPASTWAMLLNRGNRGRLAHEYKDTRSSEGDRRPGRRRRVGPSVPDITPRPPILGFAGARPEFLASFSGGKLRQRSALHAIRRQGGPEVCPTNDPSSPLLSSCSSSSSFPSFNFSFYFRYCSIRCYNSFFPSPLAAFSASLLDLQLRVMTENKRIITYCRADVSVSRSCNLFLR